ncbi:autotransporter domain-containing protein [Glaesserella parasuis]|nr:autotransporter domain-containing protein [Glaesserella parasuis]MDO9771634.1 autotransporter domain-containing protein [Glaesserella parasuis]MDO9816450.1 autotransporter domain-containing protein [Glaesserella parasuis]MDP0079391.1 autotransporter domain-containing protein [Glaesserella parasuis]MDP0213478.1 autotransporter domain-containing protein [Glaesserella parasuis]
MICAPTALELNNVQASESSKLNIGENTLSIQGNINGKVTINTTNENNVHLTDNNVLVAKNGSYIAEPKSNTPETSETTTQSPAAPTTPTTEAPKVEQPSENAGSETTASTSAQPTDATAPTNEQTETSSASANHNKITITTAEQETQRTIAESRYATLVSNFAQFSETYKTQTYGMALYGAYETEERHYFDVAVRMAKASSELKSNASQTYHHNLYSASLAYSKGFELSNRWEIEPYTQLFYTHLSSTNYIRNGLNVTADEINSLVGSVGTKAEYQLNQILNFYTKVAMHREFNATQDINIIRSATDRVQHNINHRGTWTTLGLGMKARLGNNTHLYLDVDKLFGNGYKQSYQINLGLDWKF